MVKKRPRVMVVEDAAETQLIVRSVLNDCEVTACRNLAEAKAALESGDFDLFVLDIGLPDGDGFEFSQILKERPQSEQRPILFLSARNEEVSKLKAFEHGAWDYIAKPFSALEFKARVQVHLKHSLAPEKQSILVYPPLRIDLEKRRAEIQVGQNWKDLELTNLEFELLVCLSERPEVAKSRQTLLDQVWGENISVTERTVDVHVSKLRKKLGPLGDWIQSHHGHGYSFKQKQKAS